MAVWNVIEHVELSSSAATWQSGAFPTTYDHLYIVMSARSDRNAYTGMLWQFGGNTSSLYSMTDLQTSSSSSVSGYRITNGSAIGYPPFSGGDSTADAFGSLTIWIPHYANTSNYKSMFFSASAENATNSNSEWEVKFTAGLWRSTSAVTSFSVSINGPAEFDTYSSYTVYGINGA